MFRACWLATTTANSTDIQYGLLLDFSQIISILKAVVTVLWEYFTMALPDSDLEKSRDAILLLGMCGASEVLSLFINH